MYEETKIMHLESEKIEMLAEEIQLGYYSDRFTLNGNTTGVTVGLKPSSLYEIITNEYNLSTGAYRGHRKILLSVTRTGIITKINECASTNAGVSISIQSITEHKVNAGDQRNYLKTILNRGYASMDDYWCDDEEAAITQKYVLIKCSSKSYAVDVIINKL